MNSSPPTITPSPANKPRSVDVRPPEPSELRVEPDAIAEAFALKSGVDLDDQKKLNDLNKLTRDDKAEGHIHYITVAYIYGLAVIGAISIITIFYHFLTPKCWHFLDDEQVVHLEELLAIGGSGAFLDRAARKLK